MERFTTLALTASIALFGAAGAAEAHAPTQTTSPIAAGDATAVVVLIGANDYGLTDSSRRSYVRGP